jgi:hypothetical protein
MLLAYLPERRWLFSGKSYASIVSQEVLKMKYYFLEGDINIRG